MEFCGWEVCNPFVIAPPPPSTSLCVESLSTPARFTYESNPLAPTRVRQKGMKIWGEDGKQGQPPSLTIHRLHIDRRAQKLTPKLYSSIFDYLFPTVIRESDVLARQRCSFSTYHFRPEINDLLIPGLP